MNKLPNHTALKEWSNVVAGLGRGEQILLVRKGGIADPSFGIEAERFYLYPTYFHQGESEARPTVTITHWCEVVQMWTLSPLPALRGEGQGEGRLSPELARLAPLVVLPEETLAMRFRFRPDQALYVIAVRAWELARPVEIDFREAYGGCRSWISIDDEIDIDGSRPVLDERELAAKIDSVNAVLTAAA
jgi:hypothetical protein